ncbi:MAG: hypothetical protein L6265_11520, partial [Thermoplasmatales archaeon]|nr:hypothetical protein [Thermoplasmatales archaeon]
MRKMRKLFLITVCLSGILLLVSLFPGLVSKAEGSGYHEDIIVVNETRVEEDPEYKMDGVVFVDNGALTFRNTNIAFFSDVTNHYYINITNGSTLILENVYLTTEKKVIDPYLNLTFTISNSTCIIKNSTLAYPGWLTVTNSNITIENSTITSRPEGGYGPLMFFENSNVTLAKARIENYYETAHTVTLTTMWPSEGVIVPPGSQVEVTTGSDFYSEPLQSLPTSRLASTMLVVSYETEENYNGSNYFQWSVDGVDFRNCSNPWESSYPELREYEICPKYNGTKYDLWARGVRDVADISSIYIKFVNNDVAGLGRNVTVKEIKIISACENDITFVNSSLYAFDSYIDVDFQSSDVDPVKDLDQRPTEFLYIDTPTGKQFPEELKDVYMEDFGAQHNVIRLVDNSTGDFYNVTVDGVAVEDSDPCILADSSSKAFVGRWVVITAMDTTYAPLENVSVGVTRGGVSIETPDEIVLTYLGKNPTNYNLTEKNGVVTLPLHSDLLGAPPAWPNSHISQNYKLSGEYLGYESSKYLSLPAFPNITSEANTLQLDLIFDQLYIDFFPVLTVSNEEPVEDDVIWINITVHNNGTLDGENVEIGFYLDGEMMQGYPKTKDITEHNSTFLSNPWTATPGWHTFQVVVDENNVIPEKNDNNNNDTKMIYVYTKPDLTVSSITFSGPGLIDDNVWVNSTVWINATIQNTGETDASHVVVRFLDGGAQIDEEIIDVAAGGTENVNIVWNATPTGTHTIWVKIDPDKIIDESNENNNDACKTINVRTRPDLEVKSIILSSDVEGSITISVNIRNNGGTDVSNVKIEFYDGFNLIKTTTVSVLASDESIVSITHAFTAGSHTIKVIVDPDNEIYEFNEGNNEYEETFTIKTKPDLYINKIIFSNMNPIEGDIFNVTAYIYNNGEANATADISFYWNGMLAAAPANIFVPGNGFTTTTIPFNSAGRPRIVTFNIKITNCIPSESNTNNNELSKSLSIYLSTFDWILGEDMEIDYDPLYTGHIVVKKAFTISNTSFTMQQSTDNQYHIIVLDDGKLILENASLISNYALNIYLYDNATLTVINSTLLCNIKGETSSEIMFENSVINGTFDIICDELVFVNSTLNGDLNIESSSVSITTSYINGSNNIESSVFYAENSNFTSNLALGGSAHLINVTAKTITSKNGGIILRDWFAEINVKDGGSTPVENATIRVYFKTGGVFCANATIDKDGRAVIPLLAWNITSDGNKFMGVYNFTAEYRIANKSYNVSGDFDLWHNNTVVSAKFLETIIEPSSLIVFINPVQEVKAGETTNISGTIKYN